MTMENKPSRFDDWQDINVCEQCECWWNNTCDGVKSSCNAFKPTRRTEIPQEIDSLRSSVKWLTIASIFQALGFITHFIAHLIG